MFITSLTLCRVSMSPSWFLKSINVGLASGSFCQQFVMIWYLKLIYLHYDHHFLENSYPGFWQQGVGLSRKQESKLTTYHPRVVVQAFYIPVEVSLQFFFHPFVDKATRLKNNYLGIIPFLKTNFIPVPPVSSGGEWNCMEKINSFVHLDSLY